MKFLDTKIQFTEDILIVPVWSDIHDHWVINQISFFYIYTLRSNQEYIINFSHNDDNCVEPFDELITTERQFVYNKKYLTGTEAKCLIWLQNNELQRHKVIHLPMYHNTKNVNDVIPIMLLLNYCRDVKDEFILGYNKFDQWTALTKYSDLQTNLSIIEHNGLYTEKGYEYTEYNLYTLTGRPSNHFNNINYAALNKENGSRNRFISRFGQDGFLIEFDLRAFHVFLLSKLVKYEWPDPDIYAYFQTLYGSEVNSKEETFKQIYGGIDSKYSHIEFFQMIDQLTKYLYSEYEVGNLKTFLFDRKFTVPNLNELKVLNYLLQSFETEFNSPIISKLNTYLYTQHSKLVLYTYDSFLIDFCKKDGKDGLLGLIDIFKKIPHRVKKGWNYGEIC